MPELQTTLTQKGQVTIPVEIRTRLGLKPTDKVQFTLVGDVVTLKPAPSRVARHFGAVPVTDRPLTAREEREAFENGVADEVVAEDR